MTQKPIKTQIKIPSPLGPLFLVASDKGLCGIYKEKQPISVSKLGAAQAPNQEKHLRLAATELAEYFAGRRKFFTVALDLDGTPFQRRVWAQLRKIPYGQTCSYKDIARGIRNEKAFRAVGSANGKNPACIIVPCHRVIAHDGSLGGYSGGLKMKTALLEIERQYS